MLEQEIINNKIQKILRCLSDELSIAWMLAEDNSAFLTNIQNLPMIEILMAKYQNMEVKGILPSQTNGMAAFLNAVKVTRDLLSVIKVPNVMGSEVLQERTNYYVNGLYAAYKEEKQKVVNPKKMNYHMMATFSERCIQEEWIDLERYRLEALEKCATKKRMCEYIRENYENRKKEEVKSYKKVK